MRFVSQEVLWHIKFGGRYKFYVDKPQLAVRTKKNGTTLHRVCSLIQHRCSWNSKGYVDKPKISVDEPITANW